MNSLHIASMVGAFYHYEYITCFHNENIAYTQGKAYFTVAVLVLKIEPLYIGLASVNIEGGGGSYT